MQDSLETLSGAVIGINGQSVRYKIGEELGSNGKKQDSLNSSKEQYPANLIYSGKKILHNENSDY